MAHAKGEHYEQQPLDLDLLAALPPEGSNLLGDQPLTRTVDSLRRQTRAPSPRITARLRSMKYEGLVVSVEVKGTARVTGSKEGLCWQRTAKGTAALAANEGSTE